MSAAIIESALRRDGCWVKLGRTGKKSVEGSAAMFCVCFVVGCILFLRGAARVPVFFGSLAATLVEFTAPRHQRPHDPGDLVACDAVGLSPDKPLRHATATIFGTLLRKIFADM